MTNHHVTRDEFVAFIRGNPELEPREVLGFTISAMQYLTPQGRVLATATYRKPVAAGCKVIPEYCIH